MAENLNPNQNQKPVQSSLQNQPVINQPQTKPAEPGFGEILKNFGGPKIVLAVLAVAILAAALGFYYFRILKVPKPEETALPPLASIDPNATPPQLPNVQEEDKKASLREFFKKASPANYKEKFLEQVPEAALEPFKKILSLSGGTPEEKKAAARGFYIVLNNPGADRSDPAFEPFLTDVKAALEKEVGIPIF